MDKFEIEFAYGAKVVFEHKKGSHQIQARLVSSKNEPLDEIQLNHNEKLRVIKWLVNSINS